MAQSAAAAAVAVALAGDATRLCAVPLCSAQSVQSPRRILAKDVVLVRPGLAWLNKAAVRNIVS